MGVRTAGRVQLITTILKLLPLLAIGTAGFLAFKAANLVPLNPTSESLPSAVTATAALTLWAFLGLESATIPSAGIANPRKTIPRATVYGTLVTAAVYIAGCTAVMGIIPRDALTLSTAPFADAARHLWGPFGAYAVGFGAAVSCFGALNGWILLQGQWPLAAARDNLFPKVFSQTTRKDIPVKGLVLSSVFVTALVLTNYTRGLVEQFTFIILLATLATLVPYVFATMSLIMLRIKNPEEFGPRVRRGSCLLAILAFLYSLWAIGGSGTETVYWGFLLLMGGVPVYVWLKWRQSK
jgi:APA family basic amino acid/polyamine antiporter